MKEHFLNSLGERLEWIIKELEYIPSEFSRKLGYKSPDTIYHIISGKNGLSSSFCSRLNDFNKEISIDWLLNGDGSPFNYNIEEINRLFAFKEIYYPSKLSFHWLKDLAVELSDELFYGDSNSYSAHVAVSGIGGLDFIFTGYADSEDKEYPNTKYAHKYYNILINPDWTIGRFFDYWNSPGSKDSLRYDNMFYILKDEEGNHKGYSPKREYTNIVYKFLKSLKLSLENIRNEDDLELPYLDNSLDASRKLVELFSTDSRQVIDRKKILKFKENKD